MDHLLYGLTSFLCAFLLITQPLSLPAAVLDSHPAGAACAGTAMRAEAAIYTDSLAPGWDNWSWAAVDLAAAAPVHSGSRSIAVTYGAWEGLYLHHPQIFTTGYTHLRFFIHGGISGGQELSLYATLPTGTTDVEGPRVGLPQPEAGAWVEVLVPLAELGAENGALTGLVWQGASSVDQTTLYLDDIALVGAEHPDGPVLSEGRVLQRALPADGRTGAVIRLRAADPQGAADIASISITAGGLPPLSLLDNGRSNDGGAGDGLYGGVLALPPSTLPGELALTASALDAAGHQTVLPLGPLVALAPAGGSIPEILSQADPARLAWGSNAWSEEPGEDWQANSGVPWDYVYQYITYEWYLDGWGGNFVQRFIHQAWDKGFIPVVTVYMLLALPPACGEGAACYAQKLQNPAAVQSYLAALQKAAAEASGDQPVIFNLEPDFYGFMQQYSNSAGRPAHIRPDVPTSFPVALQLPGYPDNLAGFGRRMVDLIHLTAPNALVGPMASMWATNSDPQSVSAAGAAEMGRRAGDFIQAMGGQQADLLFVEWSDRDAGSGLRPWWDDTDLNLPRPTRAILWENALSAQTGKRLVLWQVPVGNMALDDTCGRYRDNRAAYLFNHPRDLFDAGVIAVLFGGGAECMTSVTTDGGFVAAQGAAAYAPPAAPTGLVVSGAGGPALTLYWTENTEPDLWRYRVTYTPVGGGPTYTREAGRNNSAVILLPFPGEWRFWVAAIDAMGNASPNSPPATGEVTSGALFTFLPGAFR
jgi:hypothetical protein